MAAFRLVWAAACVGFAISATPTASPFPIPDVTGDEQLCTLGGTGSSSYTDATLATGTGGGYWGVASNANGILYVVDGSNKHLLRKVFLANGTSYIVAGSASSSGSAITSFNAPRGVCVDTDGSILVADTGNNRISRSYTSMTLYAGGSSGSGGDGAAATSAGLSGPYGVACGYGSTVYIADTGNSKIRSVSGGTINTVAGTGTAFFSGDSGAATSATLNKAQAVAIGPSSTFFIADTLNHRVRKVSATGIITTIAGTGTASSTGDGGTGTSATLSSPIGIFVDVYRGYVYVSEGARVRKLTPSGSSYDIDTVAGGGATANGASAINTLLTGPMGLTIGSTGMYIADKGGLVLRSMGVAFTCASPSPSPSSAGAGVTASVTVSRSASATGSKSISSSPSASVTASVTATRSISRSFSMTSSLSPSATPSVTPSSSPSASLSTSWSITAIASVAASGAPPSTTDTISPSVSVSIGSSPAATLSSSGSYTNSVSMSSSSSASLAPSVTSSIGSSPAATISSSGSYTSSVSASPSTSSSLAASASVSTGSSPAATVSISGSYTATMAASPSVSQAGSPSVSSSPSPSFLSFASTGTTTVSPSSSGSQPVTPTISSSLAASAAVTTSPPATASVSLSESPSAAVTSSPPVTPSTSSSIGTSPSTSTSSAASSSSTATPLASISSTQTASGAVSPSSSPHATLNAHASNGISDLDGTNETAGCINGNCTGATNGGGNGQASSDLSDPKSPLFAGAVTAIAVLACLMLCLACCYMRYKRFQDSQKHIRKLNKYPGVQKSIAGGIIPAAAPQNVEDMEARKKQLSTLLQQGMQAQALAACLGLADYEPSNIATKDWTGLSSQVQKCGLPDRILSAFGSMTLKSTKGGNASRAAGYWDQPAFKVAGGSSHDKSPISTKESGCAGGESDTVNMVANPFQGPRASTRVVIPVDGKPPAVPLEASYCVADVPRNVLQHLAVVCAQVSNVLTLLAACAAKTSTQPNTDISEHNGFDHFVNSLEGAVSAMAAVVSSAASDLDSDVIFAALPAAIDAVCADMMLQWLENHMVSSMSISQRRNLFQHLLRTDKLWCNLTESVRQGTIRALESRAGFGVSFGGYMAIQVRGPSIKRTPFTAMPTKDASSSSDAAQGNVMFQKNPMARKGL